MSTSCRRYRPFPKTAPADKKRLSCRRRPDQSREARGRENGRRRSRRGQSPAGKAPRDVRRRLRPRSVRRRPYLGEAPAQHDGGRLQGLYIRQRGHGRGRPRDSDRARVPCASGILPGTAFKKASAVISINTRAEDAAHYNKSVPPFRRREVGGPGALYRL